MKKIIGIIAIVALLCAFAAGCVPTDGTYIDTANTKEAAANLQTNQPTPTDISYSLERYNLIRRTYWVNGQREKANTLPCEIQKPLGYIVLFSGSTVVGNFVVDGKVSSLNSFLTPDTTKPNSSEAKWLADIDGSYGENDAGIFFFTPDGNYYEWDGTYLYSDIPFVIDDPVIKMEVGE
jgi:hypothetical protein